MEKLHATSATSEAFQKEISQVISEISGMANLIPGVVVIHKLPELDILFMSQIGLKLLGVEWDEIKNMTYERFQKNFFNEDDAKDYTPRILDLLSQDTNEFATYFQQVKTSKTETWDWYMSATRVLLRNNAGKPILLLTVSMRIDPDHYFTAKAARLLEENEFLKKHYHQFAKLTAREQDVLKLLALGKTAPEIAEILHISVATVETHRKKVYQKLDTNNSYVLSQYARVFNLI